MDIVSGKVADLEMLEYVPDISDNPKAVEVIGELIDKLPDIEVRGSLEKFQTAILAVQIDQLSYDYAPYQYRDTVEDRDAQIATIAEDIRSGNTEYLHDFLNAIVSDGIREGVVDMFGKGMNTDNSEAIQTVRKAYELLDKLSAYKPLAKVEELEEGNYNMVDNVLNNGAEKKEQERVAGRISIREKLAEKKAAIEHKDKTIQKDQDKKHKGRCRIMSNFTVEEINLMCVFDRRGRTELIEDIGRVLPHLHEQDMEELAKRVIGKLHNMTDEEFAEVVLEVAE